MKDARFFLLSLLIILLQVLIWAEFDFSPYLVLALLPTMVLCLPIRISEIPALLLTFCAAFATDFLSDGILGLSIAALLPVCFLKNGILRLVFGSSLFARNENLSFSKAGIWRFSLALILANSIFLLIYILVDAAGTRSFHFLFSRFILSVPASTVAGLLVAKLLDPQQKRWN